MVLATLSMSITVAPVALAQTDCNEATRSAGQYGDAAPNDPSLRSGSEHAQSTPEECERAAYGAAGDVYEYPGQYSVADVVEEAADDASEDAPEAAGSLTATREAAFGTARDAGAEERTALAEEQQDAAVPESAAEEEENEASDPSAPDDNASGRGASGGIDELPATGGALPALGAVALLLAGGLVARRIVG